MINELTHLSLFSGIGGLDIAAEWAGFLTIGQCECEEYPYRVLIKHWPNVPKWRNVCDVSSRSVAERTGKDKVTVISGGFPCQPFSVAGKRRGKRDNRYLWPEMFRIAKELQSNWIIGENVYGILSEDDGNTVNLICSNLESIGYEVWILDTTADAFDLPTLERHIWFIAAANSIGWKGKCEKSVSKFSRISGEFQRSYQREQYRWNLPESRVCGMGKRIPHRVDRLKCLGNAVPPQQAFSIFNVIAEIEERRR